MLGHPDKPGSATVRLPTSKADKNAIPTSKGLRWKLRRTCDLQILLAESACQSILTERLTMGAYVSIPYCATHYNVTLECEPPNATDSSIGGVTRGGFAPDPDIAGIGVRVWLRRLPWLLDYYSNSSNILTQTRSLLRSRQLLHSPCC